MDHKVLPYKDSDQGKKQQVTRMFNTISGNYDRLNRVISLGIDQRWRRRVVDLVARSGAASVLDIATGTGDLAIALAKTRAKRIVGLDIAENMLSVGRHKVSNRKLADRIEMVVGDGESLPFENNHFDAVTVAFGVRNFEDLDQGLSEILRVLRPGGRLVVLETSVPSATPLRWGYRAYTRVVLPVIGRMFSRDGSAYGYLSDSAAVFPHGLEFNNILSKNGFIGIENLPQTLGVATIYIASKA